MVKPVVLCDSAWASYCRAESERLLCRHSNGICGLYGLQLAGWPMSVAACDKLAVSTLFRYSPQPDPGCDVKGALAALPFESESLALVLVPFSLDGEQQPEAVLEEIDRVLMPEGHLVLMSMNGLSPWGLRAARPLPGCLWMMRYLISRGYDITTWRRYLFRPPLAQGRWLGRLAFMDRLRLGTSGAGLIVARKRIIGVPPVGMALSTRHGRGRERTRVPAGLAGGGAR